MLYLLYGDEDLLIHDELKRLLDSLGEPDLISLNTETLEAAETSFAELQAKCSTIAFLAPARVIIVNGLLKRFGRAEGGQGGGGARGRGRAARGASALSEWEPLPEFVTQMPDTTHLILVDGVVDRTNPLLTQLAPVADVRQFNKLKGNALDDWMRGRVKELGATFVQGASQQLVQFAGDDLWTLSHELEKLALYAKDGRITKEDVEAMVPQARESTIFQLIDAVAASDVRRAQVALHYLSDDGNAPPYVLFMLARQFRLLLQAKGLQQQGIKGRDLQSQLGVNNDFAFQKVLEQERRYTALVLEQAFERLLDADIAIKTGQQRGEIVLELLVVDLCQARKPVAR